MPAVEQNAAGQRQTLAQTPFGDIELALHLGLRPRDQFVFSQVHRVGHYFSIGFECVMPLRSTA